MKIEMGESLFYSWLRHVKECQIVQTNWKVSTQWRFSESEEIHEMMSEVKDYFSDEHGFNIFKQNTLSQLLQQGECDIIGISIQPGDTRYYAVDVAFHEAGLNYGTRTETVKRILKKCVRTAFCLQGYLYTNSAEIIFASPKINPSILSDLTPCMKDMNELFTKKGYDFDFRIIANEDYDNLVLKPILLVSDEIADTSELFLRSYQMFKMFSDINRNKKTRSVTSVTNDSESLDYYTDVDVYQELKIGQIAQKVLRPMLCDGYASDEEIAAMQTVEYSKQEFDLQYPLLRLADEKKRPIRYYANPLDINGKSYYMCSEWFEKKGANNDRPYLIKWIEEHKK